MGRYTHLGDIGDVQDTHITMATVVVAVILCDNHAMAISKGLEPCRQLQLSAGTGGIDACSYYVVELVHRQLGTTVIGRQHLNIFTSAICADSISDQPIHNGIIVHLHERKILIKEQFCGAMEVQNSVTLCRRAGEPST